ncbi:hypothetical protein [Terrabacter terrigena]|uniref:Uncharacterized protein n=1 Tax=Terrabacter terrigena TaxID=574718 RepID=A0ABW3MZN9_9MICO
MTQPALRYFKWVSPDGTDSLSGTIRWAPAGAKAEPGAVVCQPDMDASLHATTEPEAWEAWAGYGARLLELAPVEEHPPVTINSSIVVAAAWRIVRELEVEREVEDSAAALGPQAELVQRFVSLAVWLREDELDELACHIVATEHDRHLAESVAKDAGRDPSRLALWSDGRAILQGPPCAVRDALWALVARDLIGTPDGITGECFTQGMYDRLTLPYRQVIGLPHPDDG